MEENKQIKFAVEDIKQIDFNEYEEDEFSIAKVGFLSTRPNSHGLEISEEVLRRDAKTVLGKWIVCDINPLTGDATTHTNNQSIVGYVPSDQEVEFVEDADGYIRAYVIAIISKIYAKDFCEIFVNSNERAVSVEMKIATKDGRDMNDIVEQLKIVGVTVLGKNVKPSVPQSDIEIVRFSKFFHTFKEQKMSEQVKEIEEVEETNSDLNLDNSEGKEETAMNEIEFAAVDIGALWGKLYDALSERYPNGDLGSLYRIAGIYEESNKKFAIIYRQGESVNYRLDFTLTEEGLSLADEIVKIEVEFVPTDEVKRFAEPENVAKYSTFESPVVDDDDDVEEKEDKDDDDENDDAKMSVEEMTAKIAEMEKAIEERDNIIMQKDSLIADLTAYKAAREEQDKTMAVEGLLSQYSKFMDADMVNKFRADAKNVAFADIDGWKNMVKASIVDRVAKEPAKDEGFTRMSGMVETSNAPKELWERVAEMGNK